jgi:hypothetical protein
MSAALRLHSTLPSLALLAGSAFAVPFSMPGLPFQADVPAGWSQRAYPNSLPGVVVAAPGTPPPVVIQVFFPPYKSSSNDARALSEFIGGVEEGATGGGQATLKQLSERALTVGGVRGTERTYALSIKANGAVVRMRAWYGAGPRNLYQFQAVSGAAASPAQVAAFDKVLSTVKFK